MQAFLQIERAEQEKLNLTISEQKQTIHQLTHHLKLLHTNHVMQRYEENYLEFNDNNNNSGNDNGNSKKEGKNMNPVRLPVDRITAAELRERLQETENIKLSIPSPPWAI